MRVSPVSVERRIPAAPEEIFDLLARPERHAEFDGSGTVKGSRRSGRRLAGVGDSFGMDMHWGVAYATKNIVTEFEEGRRIAWQVRAPKPLSLLFTGRTWRYELEPSAAGTETVVRETWDPGTEALPARHFIAWRLTDLTRRNMERTLERLQESLAS